VNENFIADKQQSPELTYSPQEMMTLSKHAICDTMNCCD